MVTRDIKRIKVCMPFSTVLRKTISKINYYLFNQGERGFQGEKGEAVGLRVSA